MSFQKSKNASEAIDGHLFTCEICSMEYKKHERHMPLCLECGNQIRYGRTDKKFCCDDCKTRHHNNLAKAGRIYKSKVNAVLGRNYEILEEVIRSGADVADLGDLMALGFAPGMVTSYRRRGKHDEFDCYDIRYIMTRTRLFSIRKIRNLSVNLQIGMEMTD